MRGIATPLNELMIPRVSFPEILDMNSFVKRNQDTEETKEPSSNERKRKRDDDSDSCMSYALF